MDKSAYEKHEEIVYKVAAASSDGIVINKHFGRADTFYIYEIAENGKYRLLETSINRLTAYEQLQNLF